MATLRVPRLTPPVIDKRAASAQKAPVNEGIRNPERQHRPRWPTPGRAPRSATRTARSAHTRSCYSVNSRDQAVAIGKYMGGPVPRNLIPLSDGAGEVVSAGPGTTRFKPGDRVAATFFPDWIDGPMAERRAGLELRRCLRACWRNTSRFTKTPWWHSPSLSFEEAATLPCAGVTAWHALVFAGDAVQAGDTVLCLGTGGVSIAALQLARAAGASVIVTSSSDEKIQRAIGLGDFQWNQLQDTRGLGPSGRSAELGEEEWSTLSRSEASARSRARFAPLPLAARLP